MKKLVNNITLATLSLLPASVLAYTAPTVDIIDPKEETKTASGVINAVIGWVLLLVGAIAVLFLVWGGIKYVTSAGNKDKAESAKQTITYAVIGLIVVILAEVIVSLVTGTGTSLFGIN